MTTSCATFFQHLPKPTYVSRALLHVYIVRFLEWSPDSMVSSAGNDSHRHVLMDVTSRSIWGCKSTYGGRAYHFATSVMGVYENAHLARLALNGKNGYIKRRRSEDRKA